MFPKKSFIVSPIATLYLLAQLSLYSIETTQKQLLRALNLDNTRQVRCAISQINPYITVDGPGIEFYSAGSNIVGNIQYPFTDEFKEDMIELIIGRAFNVDFRDPLKAVNTINNVIADETNNTILNLYSSTQQFDSNTKIVFATGLSFKSDYKYGFDLNNIRKGPFRVSSTETIQENYVNQRYLYNYTYSQFLRAEVLEVILVQNYCSIFILPDDVNDLNSVIIKLQNDNVFTTLYESFELTLVNFTFPYFTDRITTVDIKKIIEETLVVPDIFNADVAQFRDAIEGDKRISLSAAQQKIRLLGDFNGGPTPTIRNPSQYDRADFRADRPFCYYICVFIGNRRVPIFSGCYV